MDVFEYVTFDGKQIPIPFISNGRVWLPEDEHPILAAKSARHNSYVYHNVNISGHLAYWGALAELTLRDRYWRIQPGEVVMDCGASYGSYTMSALADGADMVYAYEPLIDIANALQDSINLNGFKKRARVFKKKADSIDSDLFEFLDRFRKRLDRIKIDVEGDELDVIKGARQIIERFKPMLLIECHTFKNNNIVAEVLDLVKPIGRLTVIDEIDTNDAKHIVIDFPI